MGMDKTVLWISYCSVAKSCLTIGDPVDSSTPGCSSFTISWNLFMSIESMMPSKHLMLCCPLLLLSVFPNIRFFPVSRLFVSPGQSVGAPASASVLPVNIQGWFPLGSTGLISFWSKGLSRVLQPHSSKVLILPCSTFFLDQLSHPHLTTGKVTALTLQTSVGKVISLLSNMLSRFVIAFLPRGKRLLISWLQSASAVILEPKKIKTATISTFFPSICHEVMGLDAMILVICMLSFKPAFSLSSLNFIKRLFSFSLLSAIGYWYFPQQSWFQLVIRGHQIKDHLLWRGQAKQMKP